MMAQRSHSSGRSLNAAREDSITGGAGRRVWLGVCIIIIATLIAYLPAINGGFIWDDDDYVTENELLRSPEGLARIWVPKETRQYYPIVFTTFWIEYQLWELEPLGYHVVNVLLHIANALLLWLIMRKLGIPGSWMIGAVFALHPVHVESVAWITERKNVLSGFFYLTAALAYFRFDPAITAPPSESQPTIRRRWPFYALAMTMFVLALLSKSVTCSLPAAIILIMLLKKRPLTWRSLWPLAPMFVVGLVAAMHTAHLERINVGATGPEFDHSFLERSLIASRALLFYVWKLVIPHPLVFVYPRWDIDTTVLWQYAPVAIVLAVAAAAVVLFVRGRRGPAVALAYFAGTAFPALGYFNVFPHRYSFVADHFIYLASIGVIALVVAGSARLLRQHERWRVALAAAVLGVFGVLTWLEGPKYASAESLWRTTIPQNPDAWLPRTNLANILLRRAERLMVGGYDDAVEPLVAEAEVHSRTAVALAPDVPQGYSTLAESLRLQGRYEEALQTQLETIEVAHARVGDVPPERLPQIMGRDYFVLGRLYHLLDRYDEAASAYRMSLLIRPVEPVVWRSLGQVLVRLEQYDEAREVFQRLVELTPNDVAARGSLAGLLERTGDRAAAERAYERALSLAQDPGEQIQIMTRLIRLLTSPAAETDDLDRATQLAEHLLALTGGANPAALDVLASVHARAGRLEEAIGRAEEALERARATGRTDLAAQIEARLNEYRLRRNDAEDPLSGNDREAPP